MEPLLSIIVPTVDRTSELERLLLSLDSASLPDTVEIIIVDQNKDTRLKPVIASYESRLKLRYFTFPEKHANKARNWGASQSAARWLSFADDDCVFQDDTVASFVKTVADAEPMIVLGRVSDFAGKTLGGASNGSGTLNRHSLFHKISESALFIRRDLFVELNGFSSHFGPGSMYMAAEGIEFVYRAMGVVPYKMIIYADSIQVRHARRVVASSASLPLDAGFKYAYGVGAVIRYHRMWHASIFVLVYFAKIVVKLLIMPTAHKQYAIACSRGMLFGLLKIEAAYDEAY